MALLVGELYARVTSDSSAYRRDMQQVDQQGAASAKLAEKHGLQIANARKAEENAAGKVRVALAALEDLRNKGGASASQLAAAEERLAAAKRGLAAATDKANFALKAAVVAQENAATKAVELAAKTEEAGRQIELTDRKAGKAVGSMLALGAAGGGAGAAIMGGMAAVPVLLTLIAATALAAEEDVSDAWQNTGSEAAATVKEMAEPLRDELVLAAGQATAGLRQIAPAVKEMAADAGPGVTMLIDGMVKLATNAMPGAQKAVERSQPAFAGLNALLDRTGRGLGDFFSEISEGAPAAGREAGDLGRLLEDLLGSTGRLLAMLANEGQGVWSQTVDVIDQTTDAALGLGETALPSVASSASTVLTVMSRVLDVLGPAAPLLGTIGGAMLSYKVGAAVVGTAGDALTRLGGRLQDTAAKSEKGAGGLGRFGGALGAIGPYGALAGGSLLALIAITDQLYGSTDKLAGGLMAGGNAAEAAEKQLDSNERTLAGLHATGSLVAAGFGKLFVPTMRDAEKAVSDQRASMTSLQRAQVDAAKAAADHDRATEKYGSSSNAAAQASVTLAMRQKDLERAQYDAAQATKTLLDRLTEQQALALGLAGGNLRLRMATNQYEQAQHSLNETLKTGTASELEITAAKQGVEQAALSVVEAARQESLAHYANQGSVEAQTAALNAGNATALEMASTMSGPLPAALAIAIAGMDETALSALGATREIDGTGSAVIRLPNGKIVRLSAEDLATAKINDVHTAINNLPGSKTIELHIKQLVSTTGPTMADLGNPAAVLPPTGNRASGGPVLRGHLYGIHEQGAEVFVPGSDGTILNADRTGKLLDALAAMESGGGIPTQRGGNTIIIQELHQHQVRTLPTAQELRNVLHDVEVQYGE